MTRILEPNAEHIAHCAGALKRGEVVAFVTETVFGLGAAVNQPQAVQNIYALKQRPITHPLIAHVTPNSDISPWVKEVTPLMSQIMNAYWPGPLTMVVEKSVQMPFVVTGGQNSVALRCPAHPVAMELLTQVGVPVAAPSANRFGRVSPTRATHVAQEFKGTNLDILDGANPDIGIESTIVSILDNEVHILRPGMISKHDLELKLGITVAEHFKGNPHSALPRASGMLEKHYCPHAKVCLIDNRIPFKEQIPNKTLLVLWSIPMIEAAQNVIVSQQTLGRSVQLCALANNPKDVAQQLYIIMRNADAEGFEHIWFEMPNQTDEWAGVLDRLKRASAN